MAVWRFVQAAVRRLNLTEVHRVRALVYGIGYAIAFVSTLMFVVHGTRPDAGDASPGSRLSHSASSWPSGARCRVPGTFDRAAVCDSSLCRLADGGGGEPAEPLGHRLRAADDSAYVAGVVGRAPQDRPWVVGRRFGERPPRGSGER